MTNEEMDRPVFQEKNKGKVREKKMIYISNPTPPSWFKDLWEKYMKAENDNTRS